VTAMPTPEALVKQADTLLSGDLKSVKAHSARAACWLARSALEEVVRGFLLVRHWDPGSASMRSAMTCLAVAYADHPLVAERAQYAWTGLSSACHHHAFELAPAAVEVRHLVRRVGQLDAALRQLQGQPHPTHREGEEYAH
jgi:hypothetical protein